MKTILYFTLALSVSSPSFASYSKAICGKDLREASDFSPAMRIRPSLKSDKDSCTAFMISKRCALTAGHCKDSAIFAEFNVPEGDGSAFNAGTSEAQDIYEIDTVKTDFHYHSPGSDFAVLRLKPNTLTGLYPGEAQGHFEMDFYKPIFGEEIRLIGYGVSYVSKEKFLTQKSEVGKAVVAHYRKGYPFIPVLSSLTYTTSSTGGDSGGPVILESTGKVIGIHNAGDCYANLQRNMGTLFHQQTRLDKAIQRCLAE